jgi:hypothetical protein
MKLKRASVYSLGCVFMDVDAINLEVCRFLKIHQKLELPNFMFSALRPNEMISPVNPLYPKHLALSRGPEKDRIKSRGNLLGSRQTSRQKVWCGGLEQKERRRERKAWRRE